MISFNVNYLLKILSPDAAQLGARASTYGLGGGRGKASVYSIGIRVKAIRSMINPPF